MLTDPAPAARAEDVTPGGKRRKLDEPRSGPVDRTRCRLFVGFPEGHLRDVSQAAALFPAAASIQLPRAVDCQFETPAEAAAVAARLQAEVLAGRLAAAEVVYAERRTAPGAGRRTVLRDMTRLHVRGIQRTATVPELRELFAGCTEVTVPGNNARGNNGYAFVQFPDRETAAAALAQQLKLQDKQLTVSYAVERDMKRAGEPKFELVELDEADGQRAKQSVPAPSTDGSAKRAGKDKGKKRKHGKNEKAKSDVYKNHSTVVSS